MRAGVTIVDPGDARRSTPACAIGAGHRDRAVHASCAARRAIGEGCRDRPADAR